MSNYPDGSVTINTATITNAYFRNVSGKNFLRITFQDNFYKKTQHASGATTPFNGSGGRMQEYHQVPNYVFRLFYKRTPSSSFAFSNNRLENLWQPYPNFNDKSHYQYNQGGPTTQTNSFGVGVTPYYFRFDSTGWLYGSGNIQEFDDFGGSTSLEIEFDVNGGAIYKSGPANNTTPRAQGIRSYISSAGSLAEVSTLTKTCNSINYNNGFTEYGNYLLVIVRNCINNYAYDDGTYPAAPQQLYVNTHQVYIRLEPPAPTINYNPTTDIVSFSFNSYGSVKKDATYGWFLINQYNGIPNFETGNEGSSTPTYPYFTNLSISNPNGDYPTTNLSFIPTNRLTAKDNLTTQSSLYHIRETQNSKSRITIKGAFQYDFRLCEDVYNGNGFDTYADSNNVNYTNYSTAFGNDNSFYWNQCFRPLYTNWRNGGSGLTRFLVFASENSTGFRYNRTYDISSSNTFLTGGFYPSIDFNTEIVKINNEYLFHSFWEENDYQYLTTNFVDASYVLRMYEKDPSSNNSVLNTYLDGPVENYQSIDGSNTGLTIFPNWKTTTPSYTMDIYTDKSGNVFYNSPPISDASFNGWTDDDIFGARFLILQRNFSDTSTDIANLYLVTQACYNINVPDPSLSYFIDSSNGNITQYTTKNTKLYIDASNNWNIYNFFLKENFNLPSLINNKHPTISEIENDYNNTLIQQLSFTRNTTTNPTFYAAISGLFYFNTTYLQAPIKRLINGTYNSFSYFIYGPFYDDNNNLLTTFPGVLSSDNSTPITIDLTKPLLLSSLTTSGTTLYIYAIRVGGSSYDSTFAPTGNINLYTRPNLKFDMHPTTATQVDNNNAIIANIQHYATNITDNFVKPPFYDENGVLLIDYSGVDLSGVNPLTIDLKKQIKFYNNSNNLYVYATSIGQTGDTFDATFIANSNISFLIKPSFYFDMASSPIANGQINGFATISNVNFRPETYSADFFINPPFYDSSQSLLTDLSGIDRYSPALLDIDLTKPVYITKTATELYIFATSIGQTGNTYNSTFTPGSNLSFLRNNYFADLSYGIITNTVTNFFNVGSSFTENLVYYGSLTTTDISGVEQTSYDDISSNEVIIYVDRDPIIINTEIVNIGNEYLFRTFWEENTNYVPYLTSFLVDASYVLRLYQKNPTSTGTVEQTYLAGPTLNYQYVDTSNTGLSILSNWNTTSPYTMNIYTDKSGNVFYNSPPISDASFNGWTENEIQKAWFMILQRNFSIGENDPILIENQACYAINVIDPSLTRINDVNGFMSQLITDNATTYADASNIWNVYEYDTSNNVELPDLITISNPTRTQVNSAYPLRVGPGFITNRVINKFNIGSTFTEYLNGYNYHLITSISGEEQTPYDVSTNGVNIYDPRQTNESAYNFTNIRYSYMLYDTSKVYFDIQFLDPDDTSLREEAYDINIFKKTEGSGNELSNWYPNGQFPPYEYINDASRGVTILSNNVPSQVSKYKLDASGNVFAYGDTLDLSGSFEPGGYFVTFRRNFYKGTTTEPNAKEPFYTLNSQNIHVTPSQKTANYTQTIFGSPDISFVENSLLNRFETYTPIYGAYDGSGNIDIDFRHYIRFEGFTQPPFILSNLNVIDGSYSYVDINAITLKYTGLGEADMYMDLSYNWSTPSQLSLPIGDIGGIYPTIIDAVSNNIFLDPSDNPISTNEALSDLLSYPLPEDSSATRLNEVQDLQAQFIGTDTTRMLALKWRDPNPIDLCLNFTGYPYALRLYKKEKDGFTPNDQWYSPDNSGVFPYKYIPGQTPNYEGVGVSAEFFPQIPTNDHMYFFADASGTLFYNNYPSNTDLITPFTEPGGYLIVIQRHYQDPSGELVITLFAAYLNFIPAGPTNPWPINDNDYPIITSNPNPYSSFDSESEGGKQNLQFYWTLEIPNIGYNEIIPNEDTSGIDVSVIQQQYRNRGKEAFITSYATYNFGLSTRPFIERYAILRINGEPFYTLSSQPYSTNLCSTVTPLGPPEWPRFNLDCVDATIEEREAYQMRRKAETLRHVNNKDDTRLTKKNWFSFVSQGYNQKHQTYATQTDKFTNPNTKNYPLAGSGLTLPTDCPKKSLTFPSYSSDVPGPTVPLTFDPNVPLINYKTVRTFTNSETQYTEKDKN